VTTSATAAAVRRRRTNRLGRRFLLAALGVLAVALALIVIAAQAMFINQQDLRLLMWALVPAVAAAALVALFVARPVADDANRISDAARRVAEGDLSARTDVRRRDELGEAAAMFDLMVERLAAVEAERTLMLSAISHDLRTPLAALRAAVEALRDGVVDDDERYLIGMERQVRALAALVDDLQLHTRIASGTLELRPARVDLTELADERSGHRRRARRRDRRR
jgi:signal transduction histidine kinase